MKGLGYVVAAVAGAAIGAFIMYRMAKKTINEEPAEVVCTVDDIRNKTKEPDKIDTEIVMNSSIAQTYKGAVDVEINENRDDHDYIMVIDPDDLGLEYGRGSVTQMMMYANGILADDMDKVVDIRTRLDLFGNLDISSCFGMYDNDPDTVAIRDTLHRIDYEILRSAKDFDIMEESSEWEDVK